MNGRQRPDWAHYAMNLARVAADRSEDPHWQVGCVAMRPDMTVISVGYNGSPPGVDIDWTDRDARRLRVVHAEVNALAYAHPGECSHVAVTTLPCRTCLVLLARYGVKTIWYEKVYERDPAALQLAKEFGIELVQI